MFRTPGVRFWLLTTLLSGAVGPLKAWGQAAPRSGDGAALARELGCGACHAGAPAPDVARSRAPALGPAGAPLSADFVFTWLAEPRPRRTDIGRTRMPDFHLDEGERLALALFLGGPDVGVAVAEARGRHPGADAARGRRIYGALGCAGCHAGVEEAQPIGGPDLSREGARVREDWLDTYFSAPAPVRGPAHPGAPGARMPDFRLTPDEASSLAAWLEAQGRSFASLPEAPLTPGEARRAERFLERRGSCLGCHRIRGRGGRIAPSLEGVALRARPSFVLEMIVDPQRAAPGSPMPHQPMPLTDAERLARYLLDMGATAPPREPPRSLADAAHPAWAALAPAPDEGAALYARHCAACHGTGGGGDGWNAADLPVPPTGHADAALMGRRVDDALYDGIHAGAWVLDGSARMPAFGALLSPVQIRALVAHIRKLCGCQAPEWSRDGRRTR